MENPDEDLVAEAVDESEEQMTAVELGRAIHEWARRHGALASTDAVESDEKLSLEQIYETDADSARRIAQALQRVKITCVAADNEARSVSVLCKGTISSAAAKKLPTRVRKIDISYTGKTVIETNPPATPLSASSGAPLWFSHNNKISCGSSVTSSHTFGAGTLGFLASMRDGRIVGFSNNHVTGDSNHTPPGMHILSPSPMDASAASPPPLAIGTHLSLAPLNSGDPSQISLQQLDAAIFLVTAPDEVTSIQGNGSYDTPSQTSALAAGMHVKKIGRTTGLRHGTVLGEMVIPLPVPYKSHKFQSIVYFTGVWVVEGIGGNTFSEGGDSGSLVVTNDGSHAVGVVFAGGNNVSYIIPIDKILEHFSLTLLSAHNVGLAHEQAAGSASAPSAA